MYNVLYTLHHLVKPRSRVRSQYVCVFIGETRAERDTEAKQDSQFSRKLRIFEILFINNLKK